LEEINFTLGRGLNSASAFEL